MLLKRCLKKSNFLKKKKQLKDSKIQMKNDIATIRSINLKNLIQQQNARIKNPQGQLTENHRIRIIKAPKNPQKGLIMINGIAIFSLKFSRKQKLSA